MNIKFIFIPLVLLFPFNTFAQKQNNKRNKLVLSNSIDSLSYAIGVSIGDNIIKDFEEQGLDTVVDIKKMIKGFITVIDTSNEKLAINKDVASIFLQNYFKIIEAKQHELNKKKFENNIQKGAAFLAENEKKEGVITTANGLQYEILKKGNGEKPTAESTVEAHYHGTFLDGKVFDSSVERGEPVKFPVNRVIAGWTEALQLMPAGSKWKIWVPYNLAYGDGSGPGGKIEPYSTLVFELELLGIEKK